jgi:predicted acetyltransferase
VSLSTPAGLTLRTLTPDDIDQLNDLDDLVFNMSPSSGQVRELHRNLHRLELGRGTGLFDGDELAGVGTIGGFTMSVPGGMTPLAGVMLIGVKPTHTRRGVMSTIIRHQFQTLHDEGLEPLAGLTASESVIYGRFGYGVATYGASFSIPRHRAGLRPVAGTGDIQVRMVSNESSAGVVEQIHARQVGTRAGMLVREDNWAKLYATDVEDWRGGRSALRTVLALRDGEPVGYVRYRSKDDYSDGVASGYTDVHELHADDLAGFATLVGYLAGLDLTGGMNFHRLPVDTPLMYLLDDLRAARVHIRDALYLRIVDVDRVLALRTYSAPVDVVLELTDTLCPWNAGRWRLTGDEKSASCVRASGGDAADLALDIRELAAAYLGGATLAALAQAGLVRELRAGALTDASRAFATDLAPWLQYGI